MIATGKGIVIADSAQIETKPCCLYGYAHWVKTPTESYIQFRNGGSTGEVLWRDDLDSTQNNVRSIRLTFPEGIVFTDGMYVEIVSDVSASLSVTWSV